jgi:hypothetical protein
MPRSLTTGVERNALFLDCKIAGSGGELERKKGVVEIVLEGGGVELEVGEVRSVNW